MTSIFTMGSNPPMGNRTIYMKDQVLWDRAKELAEKEGGLSGVIAEALAKFVEQKEAELRGLSLREFNLWTDDGVQVIKFYGKELFSNWALPSADDKPTSCADLFLTRADKWLVVLKDADTFKAFRYHLYERPEEMAASGVLGTIPDREEFEAAIGQAHMDVWAKWID